MKEGEDTGSEEKVQLKLLPGDQSLPCCCPVTSQPRGLPPLVPFPPRVLAVLFQARASQVNVSLSVCQTVWLIPELPAPLPCALEASRDEGANRGLLPRGLWS